MPIDTILKKDLLFNDILNKFEPLDHTETLQVELLSLPVNSYKYIQLTGLPLNPNYVESFPVEVTRVSDSLVFSETSQGNDIQPTQYWINYHEQNYQQNGRIYFNSAVNIGESFLIRYPFIGTASNAKNIYALAYRQLYELQLTSGHLDAGNYRIKNLLNAIDNQDAISKIQLDNEILNLDNNLQNDINDILNGNSISKYSYQSYSYINTSNSVMLTPLTVNISDSKNIYDITVTNGGLAFGYQLIINITGIQSINSSYIFLKINFVDVVSVSIRINNQEILFSNTGTQSSFDQYIYINSWIKL